MAVSPRSAICESTCRMAALLPVPRVAHDEEVHRLPLARDAHPAAPVPSEQPVVPRLLEIDERDSVREVRRQPFLPAQLLVELRRRDQLRPAQPSPELPDHPPRTVLRHGHEQQHDEERQRPVRGPLHEVPQRLVLVDVTSHQLMQSTVVVHVRRPLQPH